MSILLPLSIFVSGVAAALGIIGVARGALHPAALIVAIAIAIVALRAGEII